MIGRKPIYTWISAPEGEVETASVSVRSRTFLSRSLTALRDVFGPSGEIPSRISYFVS